MDCILHYVVLQFHNVWYQTTRDGYVDVGDHILRNL